jgi:hypothetical protein
VHRHENGWGGDEPAHVSFEQSRDHRVAQGITGQEIRSTALEQRGVGGQLDPHTQSL